MDIGLSFRKLALAALGVSLLVSCAAAPPAPQPAATKSSQLSPMPLEQQEKLSLVRYTEALDMIANVPAHNIAAQLNEKYKKLIADYPDSSFAEESYYRLIRSSLRDPWPPDFDAAEKYYAEYSKNYPNPRMMVVINDFLVRSYNNYQQWDRQIKFLQPYVKRYAETGNADPAYFMYFYSEAKLGLKEYVEARRGYQTIANLYPGSAEAAAANKRLIELDKLEGEKK